MEFAALARRDSLLFKEQLTQALAGETGGPGRFRTSDPTLIKRVLYP